MTSISRLPFGSTGHQSSRLIFEPPGLAAMSQSRADAMLQTVRDSSINHIDTAASYGESEQRLFDFLQDHRHEFFLATKTGSDPATQHGLSWNRVLSVWVSTESTSSNSTTSSNRTSGRPPSPLTVPWPLCSLPSTRGWLAQSA